MRLLTMLIGLFLSTSVFAQNYADSTQYARTTLQLQLTQSAANYLAETVERRFDLTLRDMPDAILPFMGSGQNPDSTFTVTLEARLIVWMLESLMVGHTVVYAGDDFNKIVNGIPAIPGYTALANQIVTKANATTGTQRLAARYIRDLYIQTMNAQAAVKSEDWRLRRQRFLQN